MASRTEVLLDIARRWMAAGWQKPHAEAFLALHSDRFVDRSSAGRPADREGLWAGVAAWFAAFPDLVVTTEDLLADPDGRAVTIRWSAEGTHRGPYLGVDPTGRRIAFAGIEILRIDSEGKVSERWGEWNGVEILSQLRGRSS